ncbi:RNA polymerase sigma factor [Nonomuraea dietziae]|uniref:RNA polymerase sigma factor n=1 Tax=Nonomuraea dietziae TaxID=65515 RepID=UPI0033E621BD
MSEELLRELAPRVLGVLVRRYGQFDACEDAVQEALLAAATQWPKEGVPDNPKGWLVTVASRRMIDEIRSEEARRRREAEQALEEPPAVPDQDDTLTLLFLCCHPSLTPASQIALTLRAVGGLTTAEIAGAFLVPESTMAQRISRAKATIKKAGATFELTPNRLDVVLHVLYLIFNEGYTATSGPDLQRADLTSEAIRLTRTVRRLLPDDGEVAGLLALMLLTDARRTARTGPGGSLVPLAEQDRSLWDKDLIAEGVELVTGALSAGPLGAYQLQAAIAAVHSEEGETDWPQILALYELLARIAPGPMVTLNQAVAVAMVRGPLEGLALLGTLEAELADHHRLHAVRAHLLEMAGRHGEAGAAYLRAAELTSSLPERRYLEERGRPRS